MWFYREETTDRGLHRDDSPDRKEEEDEDGEGHLHVGERRESNGAHHSQLNDLQDCEEMQLSLWNAANVAVRRVRRLKNNHTSLKKITTCIY